MKEPLYLDNFATTIPTKDIVDAMAKAMIDYPGNPSSTANPHARKARQAVKKARNSIAEALGGSPSNVHFTSGATESNNIVFSAVEVLGHVQPERNRIVISSIEHEAVLQPAERLAEKGYEVVHLPVNKDGTVELEAASLAITPQTLLVSVMHVNNELGTVQPIVELRQLAHDAGALMHVDATQAVGKVPLNVQELGAEFFSLSGHKFHGPRGIGVLYSTIRAEVIARGALALGGSQEQGVRPGTLNTPGILGLAAAFDLVPTMLDAQRAVKESKNKLLNELQSQVPSMRINAASEHQVAGAASLTFPEIEDADALLAHLRVVSASAGSACKSLAPSPSHVLLALGVERELAFKTIRICLAHPLTDDEISTAVNDIVQAASAASM